MATKYKTVTETVTAIQFTFDALKEIYLFLGMKDVSYSVKDRTLGGVVTGNGGEKLPVHKNDYVVKGANGDISIWTDDAFKKHFIVA